MSLFKSLSQVADVRGVVVSDTDGEIDFHEGSVEPDAAASVAAVTIHEMSQFGSIIGTGAVKAIVLQGRSDAVIYAMNNKIASIVLNSRLDTKKLFDTIASSPWVASPKITGTDGAVPFARPQKNTLKTGPRPPLPPPHRPQAATSAPKVPAPKTIGATVPTPTAQALRDLRMALFLGDVSGAQAAHTELSGLATAEKRGTPLSATFESSLTTLLDILSTLLDGTHNTGGLLETFINQGSDIDRSLYWVALTWKARLSLVTGDTAAAEDTALAAHGVAGRFDADTRIASVCTLASTYLMTGKHDEGLSLLKSSFGNIKACNYLPLRAMAHLIESQLFAAKTRYFQSAAAAANAEKILPRSPYPKIIRGRLFLIRKEFDKADAVYEEILSLNSNQPDALADRDILNLVKAQKLQVSAAIEYFSLRETAPSGETMNKLAALLNSNPNFDHLASLIAWRRLGRNEIAAAATVMTNHTSSEKKYRFKPQIVIGYGPSAVIAAGYQDVAKQLKNSEAFAEESSGETVEPPQDDDPIYLSLPPEELIEFMDSRSEENLFSGELKMFAMPDLLEFLRNAKRTGSLILSSKQGVGAVDISEGFITSAIVPNADTIGTLLLKKGLLSKADLAAAVESQQKDLAGTRIGAVLVEKGLVDAETIRKVIVEQTFSAIATMMEWKEGRFVFTPALDSEIDKKDVEVRLNSQHVLMEIFRRLDETNR